MNKIMHNDPAKTPFVSVIMPVRNEATYVERSLGAVLAQTASAEICEILVVDGMSTDRTRHVVHNFAKDDTRIRLLDNPQHTVPFALNSALAVASGDLIVRVDGHCEIAPDYIEQCILELKRTGADAVGGPIETIGETAEAQAIALAMGSYFGMGGSAFRTIHNREMWPETVAFPAYPRSTVEKNGLFDEELTRNQDEEYNYRLLKRGGRILLSPRIRSRYYSRASLRKLAKQFYQYGFWKVRVMQKHPRQMRLRQFVPFVFVTVLLLSLSMFWPLAILTLLLHMAANGVASSYIARKHGWHILPTLFAAHALMHYAYGFGSVVGLVRFNSRWRDKAGRVPTQALSVDV